LIDLGHVTACDVVCDAHRLTRRGRLRPPRCDQWKDNTYCCSWILE